MPKILIIEDDIAIAELERDYLEAHGFQVDLDQNGQKGLEKALEGDYDLLLVDVMLPELDGFHICRQVRAKKDMPFLFVSARSEDVDKIRGLGLGADDYISKPFSPGELVARVQSHLARYQRLTKKDNQSTDKRVLSFHDLSVNIESRRVFVGTKEVNLPNKEFEILAYLMQNRGIVISKEQLFDKIWGIDSLGDTATVMVHINRLREKIEPHPENPFYIQTVWGAGYRFHV